VPALSVEDTIALRIFFQSQTQWHVASTAFGAFKTGLNYDGVKTVADAMGVEWNAPLFRRLQACERAVLAQQAEIMRQQSENVTVN
jgi:hypothetical protein